MDFKIRKTKTGIEVIDSYKVLWDKHIIDEIYGVFNWNRSKFSLYLEWFIHSICYKLHIQRDRAKDVFFEFDNKWFKNLWK